jgi:hypothetical protein
MHNATPRLHIETELSRDALIELRNAITTLLSDEWPAHDPVLLQTRQVNADRKIAELWSRVGDNIKRFLATGALAWDEGEEFSMEDIARRLDVSPKTVRSWHRNLGRSLRLLDAEYPEPKILLSRWDGARNRYRFPPETRDAIMRLDTQGSR